MKEEDKLDWGYDPATGGGVNLRWSGRGEEESCQSIWPIHVKV